MVNFALVGMLIGYSFLFGCMIYRITQEYNAAQEEKRKRLVDGIPCLCGHMKWLHGARRHDPNADQCLDHLDKDGGGMFIRCPCSGYRMDNLLFLERVERDDVSYPL